MKSIIIPEKLDKWWTAAILLDFFFFQIHNFGESHTNCYTFIKQSWFSASMVFLCGKSFCGSQIVQFLSKYDQLPVTYKVMETTESCVTYKGVHVADNTVASSNPCTRKKKLFKKIWWTIRLRQEVLAAIQQLKKKVILSLCKILACTWITVEQKKGGEKTTGQDFLGVSASQMLCCTVRELVSWGGNSNCEYGETQEWLSDYGTEFVILKTETVEHGQYSEKSQTKTRDTLSETGVAFLPSFLVHLCFKQRLIVKK